MIKCGPQMGNGALQRTCHLGVHLLSSTQRPCIAAAIACPVFVLVTNLDIRRCMQVAGALACRCCTPAVCAMLKGDILSLLRSLCGVKVFEVLCHSFCCIPLLSDGGPALCWPALDTAKDQCLVVNFNLCSALQLDLERRCWPVTGESKNSLR